MRQYNGLFLSKFIDVDSYGNICLYFFFATLIMFFIRYDSLSNDTFLLNLRMNGSRIQYIDIEKYEKNIYKNLGFGISTRNIYLWFVGKTGLLPPPIGGLFPFYIPSSLGLWRSSKVSGDILKTSGMTVHNKPSVNGGVVSDPRKTYL